MTLKGAMTRWLDFCREWSQIGAHAWVDSLGSPDFGTVWKAVVDRAHRDFVEAGGSDIEPPSCARAFQLPDRGGM